MVKIRDTTIPLSWSDQCKTPTANHHQLESPAIKTALAPYNYPQETAVTSCTTATGTHYSIVTTSAAALSSTTTSSTSPEPIHTPSTLIQTATRSAECSAPSTLIASSSPRNRDKQSPNKLELENNNKKQKNKMQSSTQTTLQEYWLGNPASSNRFDLLDVEPNINKPESNPVEKDPGTQRAQKPPPIYCSTYSDNNVHVETRETMVKIRDTTIPLSWSDQCKTPTANHHQLESPAIKTALAPYNYPQETAVTSCTTATGTHYSIVTTSAAALSSTTTSSTSPEPIHTPSTLIQTATRSAECSAPSTLIASSSPRNRDKQSPNKLELENNNKKQKNKMQSSTQTTLQEYWLGNPVSSNRFDLLDVEPNINKPESNPVEKDPGTQRAQKPPPIYCSTYSDNNVHVETRETMVKIRDTTIPLSWSDQCKTPTANRHQLESPAIKTALAPYNYPQETAVTSCTTATGTHYSIVTTSAAALSSTTTSSTSPEPIHTPSTLIQTATRSAECSAPSTLIASSSPRNRDKQSPNKLELENNNKKQKNKMQSSTQTTLQEYWLGNPVSSNRFDLLDVEPNINKPESNPVEKDPGTQRAQKPPPIYCSTYSDNNVHVETRETMVKIRDTTIPLSWSDQCKTPTANRHQLESPAIKTALAPYNYPQETAVTSCTTATGTHYSIVTTSAAALSSTTTSSTSPEPIHTPSTLIQTATRSAECSAPSTLIASSSPRNRDKQSPNKLELENNNKKQKNKMQSSTQTTLQEYWLGNPASSNRFDLLDVEPNINKPESNPVEKDPGTQRAQKPPPIYVETRETMVKIRDTTIPLSWSDQCKTPTANHHQLESPAIKTALAPYNYPQETAVTSCTTATGTHYSIVTTSAAALSSTTTSSTSPEPIHTPSTLIQTATRSAECSAPSTLIASSSPRNRDKQSPNKLELENNNKKQKNKMQSSTQTTLQEYSLGNPASSNRFDLLDVEPNINKPESNPIEKDPGTQRAQKPPPIYVQIVSTAGKNTPQTAERTRAKESPRAATQIATKSPVAKKRKSDSDSSRPQTVNQPMQREEWKKVEKKKKSLKNRKGTIRPMSDAIIIEKKAGGTSYADMLRAVKHSEELKDLSEKVKTMRPTKKGGLLIEFKRSKDVEASSYQMAIEKALDGVASVNLKTHTVTIQCKGLITDLNTEEELLEAITQQAQVKNLKMSAIRSTRTIPGGTQSMYLSLRADDAKKVLELGHLKVGWVRCRVTEVTSPRRCYRCWAYDHGATACKEPDRTKLCRRCGKEGHQAASCKNDEKCALCTGAHAAGSAKCPRYQEAVRLRKT
ncbi:mucin-5AC-like [Anastrepha ludens]|uniref:mucin-5AC-like n=1 Tax=Anastrepha ludens TaxID=28586 RepID=UPI0023AEE486|nr:mucin-5AC-like [Anastrepha ludens]